MTSILAGQLNQRITLQQRAADQSAALGEPVGAWADTATVWAQAQPLRGRELFAAGQQQQQMDVRFRIRWRSGVSPTMRVLWQGEPYDIVGEPINVNGAGVYLELMCTKGLRDGR